MNYQLTNDQINQMNQMNSLDQIYKMRLNQPSMMRIASKGPVYKYMKTYDGDLVEITTQKKRTKIIKIEDFDASNPLHVNAKLDFIHDELKKTDQGLREDFCKLVDRKPRFWWSK